MIHELQHILGFCHDSSMHFDLLDLVQYYFSTDLRIGYKIVKNDIMIVYICIFNKIKY
jgi:hypothetical protein